MHAHAPTEEVKANFLVYPDPNHLGVRHSAPSCVSCCAEQPQKVLCEKAELHPNRRGRVLVVSQPSLPKWEGIWNLVAASVAVGIWPYRRKAMGWRAESISRCFGRVWRGEQGKTGVFLCPVRQESYFCRSSRAPDKVWIVPVLDAGANTWADSWILKSSQCPSKRVKGYFTPCPGERMSWHRVCCSA